ncbi:hypothetical protein [Streptomyces sp. NRRL F-5193]|uniref:hypothetical protein n=1 Tax=Streptomyces sp. NRRL F-5193 TaxID=1463860 RepID=UPI000A48D66A|nr:hypothetical protein [Streptomyces sp. NRRL F-5193]
MAGAQTGRMLVCDDDDQRTGLIARARLTTARDSAASTGRLRLRHLRDSGGPVPTRHRP